MHDRHTSWILTSLIVALLTFGGGLQHESLIPVRFSHPDLVRYDHDGFTVRGKPIFIYSGSFHYFRCDSSEWLDRLEKIKAAGFNTIETYVAWNWHERQEGSADFAELDKFLTECEQLGLYVIIRPGPYICAEWDVGGFPEWLAGRKVGFRTASPEDLRWSKYWYDEVLPIIRRHLITNGGNIIMMQIENEYDYFSLPDSDKITYVKSLYDDAIKNGIDIPIITCWTRQVRDKTDSVFSQILDACNFYPGWNIESTLPAIEKVKSEEPLSPPMITELQGGWFSSVGDESVRHVDRYGADQIDALTKFVIAHGVKATSYYMLYGGTNFGYWGSKGRTTSYDYTAPISEPGGLWDKYGSVKLIGDFIRLAGPHLVHSHELKGGAESETGGVKSLLRTDGRAGFLFVWNTTDKPVDARVKVNLTSLSSFNLSIPMHARDAYLLPVNLPLPGGEILHYSNVQLSAVSQYNGKPLIIAYGTPGDEAMIYAGASMRIETVKDADQLFSWDGIYVLLTSKERAARSRVFETPSGPLSLVSDSYLVAAAHSDEKGLNVDLQTRPGKDSFSLLAPSQGASVLVDGKPVKTTVTPRTNMLSFSLSTQQIRLANVRLGNIRVKPDDEAPAPATSTKLEMAGSDFASLGSLGNYQNGYTIYEGEFTTDRKSLLRFDYYDDDWHSVRIDGKAVPGLTGNSEEDISKIEVPEGKHKVTIIYENEGRPNGDFMEQEKGLRSISVALPGQIESLENWRCSPTPSVYPDSTSPETSPTFNDSRWREVKVGSSPQSFIRANEGWWFRTHIHASEDALRQNPEIMFKGVDDNALVFVNGKLGVDHHGWNTPFSVPLGASAREGDNIVAVYVQNEQGPGGIYKPVVFKWGNPVPVATSLQFHYSLDGGTAGWQKESFDDSDWKTTTRWTTVPSTEQITWYRAQFSLPKHEGWIVPWRLHIESTGNIQIWLNGRLLGRYFSEGPQADFYLPDGWLSSSGKNIVAFVLRPSGNGDKMPEIKNAFVAPYEEYVVQKHTLSIRLQ